MGDKGKGNTRDRILKAALKLFADKGFEASSVRDIASAVGVQPGALYNHFDGKEQILETLVEDLTHSAIANLFDSKEPAELYPKGKALLAQIATTFKLLSFDPENEALFRLMMQEIYNKPRIRELYQEEFYQKNVKKLSTALFLMMQEDMIRSSDPLMLANEFFAPLFFYQMQLVLMKIDGKSTSSAASLFEKHVDIFWESVRTEKPSQTLF